MTTVSNSNVREREIATMRGGFVAARDVLQRLWEIEARGASFSTTESGFTITPPHGMIAREDRAFLLAHLDEAERILKYVEDNAQSLHGEFIGVESGDQFIAAEPRKDGALGRLDGS